MSLKLSVCIPTYNRPSQMAALLANLMAQQVMPDEIVVIDASLDDATNKISSSFTDKLPLVVYQHSEKGLTLQRNLAVDVATGDILIFLDDDVLLDPMFLAEAKRIFIADKGHKIGGLTGIQRNQLPYRPGMGWKLKRFLNIIETDELGRLLACGETLPLPCPAKGELVRVNFLPGGLTAWRREVFDKFRYSHFFQGYGLGEDKYFSACVGKLYELYASGDIRAEHLHVAGNRPDYFRWGYFNVFNHCFIMKECSQGKLKRVRFILFHLIDAGNDLLTWPFRRNAMRTLKYGIGRLAGLIRCLVCPPVMADNDPAQINRSVAK